MRTLLLIHSPLLGPSSWRPIADVAGASGVAAVVPDLAPAFEQTADWSLAVASLSADATPSAEDVTVAGHSGAGYYLPIMGETIGLDRVSFVFVDAVLPPASGTVAPGAAIGDLLDEHTNNGLLEPWLDWWPVDLIEQVLPNPSNWEALRQDMPTVQRAIYGESIPVPASWRDRPIRYVQTSAAYASEAKDAKTLGWGQATIDGTHLSIVTDPHLGLHHMLDQTRT